MSVVSCKIVAAAATADITIAARTYRPDSWANMLVTSGCKQVTSGCKQVMLGWSRNKCVSKSERLPVGYKS